jgi:hypothetical protein
MTSIKDLQSPGITFPVGPEFAAAPLKHFIGFSGVAGTGKTGACRAAAWPTEAMVVAAHEAVWLDKYWAINNRRDFVRAVRARSQG